MRLNDESFAKARAQVGKLLSMWSQNGCQWEPKVRLFKAIDEVAQGYDDMTSDELKAYWFANMTKKAKKPFAPTYYNKVHTVPTGCKLWKSLKLLFAKEEEGTYYHQKVKWVKHSTQPPAMRKTVNKKLWIVDTMLDGKPVRLLQQNPCKTDPKTKELSPYAVLASQKWNIAWLLTGNEEFGEKYEMTGIVCWKPVGGEWQIGTKELIQAAKAVSDIPPMQTTLDDILGG